MNSIFDELRSAVYSVWHRRWVVLAVAWAVCMLGWLVVAMIPNSYESRARIFVHLDDPLAEQIGVGVNDRKRDIERVRQTLTGAVNLEKVVRSTRLGEGVTTPKQMESVIQSLSKKIKVESEQDNLFKITAVASDGSLSDAETAKLAQDIVQKLIDIFREENLVGGNGGMGSTIEFLDQQLASRQKALEEAEKKRTEFESRFPELAQGGSSVLQRMEASRSELRGIDSDLAAAQSALAAINGQFAGTPQTIQGLTPTGGARGALAEAQGQLAGMRARGLTDNHPDVITIKNQIASLRSAAANEGGPSGQPNPAYSSLVSIRAERQANVQALQARRASVQTEISQVMAKQIQNPEVAAEAQRISRDYEQLKTQYDKLFADREALRLRGQVETEQGTAKFQIIDPPTSPRGPSAPNRPLLLFGVLLMGLGAGVGAAFAVGQLRSTFATTAKLERSLGLPVLGAISQTLNEAGRALRRKRMKQFYAGCVALLGVFVLLLVSEMIQVGMVA